MKSVGPIVFDWFEAAAAALESKMCTVYRDLCTSPSPPQFCRDPDDILHSGRRVQCKIWAQMLKILRNGGQFTSKKSHCCTFLPVYIGYSVVPTKVKFMNKVPVTPSNVPAKFCLNNQNRLGEKCKNVFSYP